MNPLIATFEDYQAQYETILPIEVRKGLTCLQTHVHHAVVVIDEAFLGPELILKMIQMSVALLSFIPFMESNLDGAKQFCKDGKNFSNFVKGLKSVDGFLNFKFSWKSIVLNVSGMTLCIVSTLSLLDRIQVVNISVIKVYLVAIPRFGILPYGGLLSLSVVGLMGMIALLALEKRGKLEKEKVFIQDDKLIYWSQPLDSHRVHEHQVKYQTKVLDLQSEIVAYEALIQKGEEIENELSGRSDQTYPIYTCRKALDELRGTFENKQRELEEFEKKSSKWTALDRNWTHIDSKELEAFRQAKREKWEAKLNKIEQEKRMSLFSIINNVIILSRQALVIVSVATGYGIVTLPLLINMGLDAAIAGCGIKTFFMKRSIKKIKIPPVDLADYVTLNLDNEKESPIES